MAEHENEPCKSDGLGAPLSEALCSDAQGLKGFEGRFEGDCLASRLRAAGSARRRGGGGGGVVIVVVSLGDQLDVRVLQT